jgi:hypothetical protein
MISRRGWNVVSMISIAVFASVIRVALIGGQTDATP